MPREIVELRFCRCYVQKSGAAASENTKLQHSKGIQLQLKEQHLLGFDNPQIVQASIDLAKDWIQSMHGGATSNKAREVGTLS